MELSPEEKKRIYEEEKTRVEAHEKARKEVEARKTRQGCGCLFLILAVIIIIVSVALFRSGRKAEKGADPRLAQYETEAGRGCVLMTQARKFTVTVSRANVRSVPSLEPQYRDGVLKRGTVIEVVAKTTEGEPFYRMISPKEGWVHTGCVQAGIVVMQKKKEPAGPQWLSASTRIVPGVMIYYGDGPKKQYAGTVVDIGELEGERAVLMEMPSGSREWKYRRVITRCWVRKSQYEKAKARYFGE